MGRKVFISYKFEDSRCNTVGFRDELIRHLKGDGNIYLGEDGYSDDLTGLKAETIKNHLKPKIHETTVTIILVSPNIVKSKWVDWEISYSLKDITREDLGRSRMNGALAVILPDLSGNYEYCIRQNEKGNTMYKSEVLPKLVNKNRYNVKASSEYAPKPENPNTYDRDKGSFISIYRWDYFLKNSQSLIENAYEKSRTYKANYDIPVEP